MSRLFETYRAIHEQSFIPLFVHDDHDSHMLLDACVEAGCRVIEYTQRRADAPTMIPWIRRQYPQLHVLVGSTLDDDNIVRQARQRYSQLRTLCELVDMGADGFVSMVGWNPKNIQKFATTHIVIPAAMTVNEAYQQFAAGAHFIKILGPDKNLVRLCRNPATFEFCPVFITGGMTRERIPEAVAAGAVVIGGGFDLMLHDMADSINVVNVGRVIRNYIDVTRTAKSMKWPALVESEGLEDRIWIEALPHNHPFDDLQAEEKA